MGKIKYSLVVRSAQPGVSTAEITETKCYAVVQNELMSHRQLCEHIAAHGGVDAGTVSKVIFDLTKCLKEQMCEGRAVQVNGLGKIYPTIGCKGAPTAADFTADRIKTVRTKIAWDPDMLIDIKTDRIEFEQTLSLKDKHEAILKAKGLSTPTVPGNDEHVVE